MNDWWWQVGWIGLWVGGVLTIAQLLAARNVADEYTRKFVHIGIGNIILLAWLLRVPLWLILTFGVVFCAVTLLSYRFAFLSSINGVNRRSWGTFYYALSITLLAAIYWPRGEEIAAVLGVLVMTWGDALAALVGQSIGRHEYKVVGMRKTLEGSATMAAVSFVVGALLLGANFGLGVPTLVAALVIAVAAAGLEVFSVGGIDNLTVPLGSAMLCSWLMQTFL